MRPTSLNKPSSIAASVALQLGVAAAAVGIALALTLPIRDDIHPAVWPFFFAAVVVSAYFAGPGSALAAAAMSVPLGVFFLLQPYESFEIDGANEWLPTILFVVVSSMIAGLDWVRRRAQSAREVSERRYGQIFEGAGVSLWREDFSKVFEILDELRARPIDDVRGYLDEHPEVVERAIEAVKILDVNSYTVELFGAKNKADMLASLAEVFTPESSESFKSELVALYEGERFFQSEIQLRRLNGDGLTALFTITVLGPPPSADVLVSVLDISDRHEAETALRENQERLEVALAAGRMGTFEWDIGAQTIRWGAEIEALRGADPEHEYEGPITEFLEMVYPDDREPLQLAVTRALQHGAEDLDIEYRALSTNGAIIWFAAKGRVLRDSAGMPVRISGVAWDVTANKRAEIALRDSEERYRTLTDSAPAMIFRIAASGGFTHASRAFYEYSGIQPDITDEGKLTWQAADVIHPDDLPGVLEMWGPAREGGAVFEAEYRLRAADGSYRWFLNRTAPVKNETGEITEWVGTLTDIHDRKVWESRVTESEERFRTMADTAPVMIWVADTANLGTWFNRPWLDFTGRALDDELGLGWTAAVHPDDLERCVATCQDAFDRREDFRMEFRFRRHDGEYRWLLDHGIPRYGPDGEFLGYIGSCIDVHERKENEERDRFLAEASAILASSLEYSESLDRIVRSVVPVFADFCVIDLIDEDGNFERVAMAYHDQAREARLWQVLRTRPPGAGSPQLVMRAVSEKESQIAEVEDPAELIEAIALDEEHRRALQMIAPRRVLVVPMLAGKGVFGTLTLMNAHPAGRFAAPDVATLEALAERAALTIENSRLYRASQRARQRQEFLVHAGAVLASSLDYDETLDHVVRLAVPEIADSCVLDLVQDDGAPRRVVFAHRDPEKQAILEEVSTNYRPYADPAHPVMEVLKTGEVQQVEIDAEVLRQITRDARHAELLAELRPASALFVPLKAHGELIGVMSTFMGADYRRSFNPDLVLTAKGLAQRAALAIENARLYAESQQVQEELRKANQAKDEFLGMVSHELRTPVTTMYSGAKLLLSRYNELDDSVKQDVIRDVEAESERLQLIIENLLALARQELGQRVHTEPVAVKRVVQSAARRLEKARPDRAVKVECCGEPHYVSCVPIYLDLVLRNVMDNADKYSPRSQPIEVSTRNRNGHVAIVVRDHGPGVPWGDEEKIYERFYRSAETARMTSGAGIGLAVCRRLMESQGGTIESRNAEGGGLEVTVSLPAYETN